MYIESSKIKVFPCGGRNKNFDPFARLTTEQNLVSIINKLVDKKSFIVTTHGKDTSLNDSTEPYIINIGGYLFTIDSGAKDIIATSGKDGKSSDSYPYIVAEIEIRNYIDTNNNIFQMLTPLISIGAPQNLIEKQLTGDYEKQSEPEGKDIYKHKTSNVYIINYNGNYYQCDKNGHFIYNDYSNSILDTELGARLESFIGIKFYMTKEPVVSSCTELTLFQYNGASWVEYEDSKIKFTTNNTQKSITIDDGDLD